MKKPLLAALCGLTLLWACKEDPTQSEQYKQLEQERQTVSAESGMKDSTINSMFAAFNNISENLRAIKEKQGMLGKNEQGGVETGPDMEKRIAADLEKQVQKGKLDAAARDAVLARVTPKVGYDALATCDFCVEAATENVDLKLRIFSDADKALPAHAILASNTSSISVTRLASVTKRPTQVVGMHFMNPVPVMKLVELVRALQTSEATFAATRALSEKMGKIVIVSKDAPGFLVAVVVLKRAEGALIGQ